MHSTASHPTRPSVLLAGIPVKPTDDVALVAIRLLKTEASAAAGCSPKVIATRRAEAEAVSESATTNGHASTLFPAHLKEFKASGLTTEDVVAAGIRSLSDRREIAAMLNRKSWSQRSGSVWAIPYIDATGGVVHWRVKPERPSQSNGKTAKYQSPTGSRVRVYFPPDAHRRIAEGEAPEFLITEGEKKSLKATRDGFCCIGLSGTSCWHGRKSTAPLADLENINWSGRIIFIVFDSDAEDNEQVRQDELLLAAALKRRGAVVKIPRLPAGPNGEKVGLDDYLVANGPSEFRRLLDNAPVADDVHPEIQKAEAFEVDPADIASKFRESLQHRRAIPNSFPSR